MNNLAYLFHVKVAFLWKWTTTSLI